MSDFIKDTFTGPFGLLSSHDPETGTWSFPNGATFDDFANYTPPNPNPATASYKLDGISGLGFDPAGYPTPVAALLKVTNPAASPDIFAEMIVRGNPDTTSIALQCMARASVSTIYPGGTINGIGGGILTNASLFDVSAVRRFSLDGSFGTANTHTPEWFASGYPDAVHDFTVRLELEGNIRRLYIDANLLVTDAISDYGVFTGNDVYFLARWHSSNLTAGDGLYTPRILSIRAGTLPDTGPPAFWQDFQRTYEIDA